MAGTDFIQELYVRMGFHPAWKYKPVFELIVFDGQVLEMCDVSQGLAKIRAEMARRPLRPDLSRSDQDIRAWIESTFRLNYDL